MIRRKFIYLSGILFALFVSSCSHEDLIDNMEETGLRGNERTITITQPDNTHYQGVTTKATASAGVATCVADGGRILIFEASAAGGPFVYKQRPIAEEVIAFKKGSDEWWEGKSSYTPEAGKFYMVYAYAYDSKSFPKNLQTELNVSGKTLRFNTGETLTAEKMASFTMPPVAGVPPGSTQEVFGEYLRSVVNGKPETGVIVGSDKRSLSGVLLRETGRLQISLTGIIPEFTKASMVMEYCNTTIPIRASRSEGIGTTPFEKNEMVTVAVSDITDGTVKLSADLFRIDKTYVYVELEKADGKGKVRYPVRCGNLEVEDSTIADGVLEIIVKDYKITVPTNYWLNLSGTYDDLNKSNLTIKTAWGKDYEFDGGYLVK